MKKFSLETSLIGLLMIYIGLFVLYIVVPQSLLKLRSLISPLMLITIGVISIQLWRYLFKR
jgi:hypothetical protein